MPMTFRHSWLLACLLWCPAGLAAGGALDEVLISRSGDEATLVVRFTCRNRFRDFFPVTPAERLQIKVTAVDRCGLAPGATPRRDSRRPSGRELAGLRQIEFVQGGDGDGTLLLSFEHPVRMTVTQRGDLTRLQIRVELLERDTWAESVVAPPEEPVRPALVRRLPPSGQAVQRARAATDNAFAEAPTGRDRTVAINLESVLQPIADERIREVEPAAGQVLYRTQIDIDNRTWYRLRLGFFADEREAEAVLDALKSTFPDAWTVRVATAEREASGDRAVAPAPASTAPIALPPSGAVDARSAGTAGDVATGASADLAVLMAEARAAMLAADNARAVQIYMKVLRAPEHQWTREAQEMLGVARERNGQVAHAVAEYRRYLMLYPDGEDAVRVRQRLAGLTVLPVAEPVPAVVAETDSVLTRDPVSPAQQSMVRKRPARRPADRGRWDVYGGFSQYYRRDASQFDDRSEVVGQSSLLTDLDVVARRRGERLDFSGRITMGNLYDLLGEGEGPGNSTRIYYFYADLVDVERDVSARVGRQSLRSSGVLGRFDGAHLGWQWRPDVRLNVSAGFPVDSSVDDIDTSREFYGASVDFTNVLTGLDAAVFYNTQQVDGIEDRQAIGGELRYYDEHRSLVSLLDYDMSYGALNSFVVLGNWAFDNRVTLNAMVDYRKSPVLTTRNALIGQPVATVQELFALFGEDEIRTLAEDRTGDLYTYSFGLSVPLFERFQINADVTRMDYSGTDASGGVPEIPDVAGDTWYTMTLIGSSLWTEGDTTIFGLGYVDGDAGTTGTFSLDSRFPVSWGLRINPRLRLSLREVDRTDSDRWTASPSLRLLYRFARRFELECEIGGQWSNEKTADRSADYSAYFVYAGYRADF